MREEKAGQHRTVLRVLTIVLIFASESVLASDISGTVINKTKGKPAAGDDVILLSLSQGMQETGRTKTDASGKFKLPVTDEGVQHLIRVVHQGVNYHKAAPQGTNEVEVEVYEVAQQVDKIFGEGRILRLQTSNGQLQVSEMNILRNESTPPRTRMSERSFELILPDGAEVDGGMAAGPGGMPVTSAPVPTGEKNHYAFIFPIRPGRTQFQITYHLPYRGSYAFDLRPDLPLAEFGVMLPKSMQFKASGDAFQQATDESGMSTYVAKSITPAQRIAFTVSGEGSAPREAQEAMGSAAAEGPGGGLGAPVKGDNPMGGTTLWYVLGGLVIALGAGAYFVTHRPATNAEKTVALADAASAAMPDTRVNPSIQVSPAVTKTPVATRANAILDLLKEELFQIETERLQGKISEQQYSDIRTGINALMRRHVGRSG